MEVSRPRSSTPPPRPAFSGTVRVEMREEIEHLVSRVQERGRFDESAARLLVDMGDDALAEMVRRFPGPLDCDRYQESVRLKRVGQHGPLLRALLLFGERAAPFVAPMLDSFDSEVRFYATFLFSEIQAPEALPGLVKRLFDGDRQIRVVALDVIKGFESHPEYSWAVQEVAAILRASGSSLEKKRLAADVLGELRDPAAIRALAEMLGSVDGILAERCQRALVKITFTDFGFSERRWIAWYETNDALHRIEWALAAINHRVEEIRQSAIDELRRMVGSAVEWPRGPADHRLRKEIRRRVISWWEREGKALNPVIAGE
jgi:HEAT repeat protein